jgi:hypothetical protein
LWHLSHFATSLPHNLFIFKKGLKKKEKKKDKTPLPSMAGVLRGRRPRCCRRLWVHLRGPVRPVFRSAMRAGNSTASSMASRWDIHSFASFALPFISFKFFFFDLWLIFNEDFKLLAHKINDALWFLFVMKFVRSGLDVFHFFTNFLKSGYI